MSGEKSPIQIHIAPELQHFAKHPSQYLAEHPQYTNLAVGAFIISRNDNHVSQSSNPRLLLVQRAATERGFPNLWEVPSGSTESSDPTIFHSLARETFEETGLMLTRVTHEIGNGIEFLTNAGSKKWMKLNFQIEVISENGRANALENREGKPNPADMTITLDPAEHQAYAWATEDDLQTNKYPITTSEQRALMMETLSIVQREEESELRSSQM